MEHIKRMIKTLFPRGRAWRLPNYWNVLIDGWSRGIADAKLWLGKVKQEIHPRTSQSGLDDWASTLGISQDSTLSIDQRRAQLEAIDTAAGGQDLVYINRIVQIVYPNCWVERISSNNVLGNREARCALATCAGGEVIDNQGNPIGSVRFFYYVKGVARSNEESGLRDLVARLCPAQMQAIWLVQFMNEEELYAWKSLSRG
ncbi:DUF2313 domain-containing protein (plasmid) [Entomospira nematocerorum]|uniref:DUF2313 domain-containing protein n=1 Tax=Entomospira nematocerorum TaxID=2719987 RepID=A0A968GE30_9SPIO|nr:putative phage tail protein [Entomospira nematocera]NIZ47813.1 DUF2313 domain-containing protein [Entomospira nematocera]WDI34746.1 DUF2313 domain-containing protein [Entomospira nematocera]